MTFAEIEISVPKSGLGKRYFKVKGGLKKSGCLVWLLLWQSLATTPENRKLQLLLSFTHDKHS